MAQALAELTSRAPSAARHGGVLVQLATSCAIPVITIAQALPVTDTSGGVASAKASAFASAFVLRSSPGRPAVLRRSGAPHPDARQLTDRVVDVDPTPSVLRSA